MTNDDLKSTLAFSRGEIDSRDPSFRIMPDGGAPYTVLLVQRTLNVGSEARQDITIQAPGIATRHARLVQEGGNYRIYDLTEYYGLLVNDARTEGSALLKEGDTVRLQDQEGRGATLIYSNPVERALGSESVGRLYPLEKSPFVIGRAPNADLVLNALAVSWQHARIEGTANNHTLYDGGSANGTFVNDRKISGSHRLRPEDVIRIDQVLLVYKGQALARLARTQRFEVEAVEVGMTYRTGILPRSLNTMRGVSLTMAPKEFIAIIGGSGSGKSTLLRALNGANRATEGKVLVNDQDLYENYELYQPIIGYVPQQDIVQDALTVYQSLYYGARLRFPNEPEASRDERITRVLDSLELTDFRERLVGRLSGGQKKRVSIALELMAEPSLLFLDEPSSGLDPGLDKQLMDTLRRLADRGHIVIVVTHTTLNIELCDQLAFMARGNLVYYGPPRGALEFFDVREYSEIYNRVQQAPAVLEQAANSTMVFNPTASGSQIAKTGDISPGEASKLWAERFRGAPIYEKYVTSRLLKASPQKSGGESALTNKKLRGARRGSFAHQARVLTERAVALVRRDMRTIITLLLVLPLVGLFLGLISFDPIDGTRGQMLVSRGSPSDYLLLLDKLKLDPVATVPPAAVASTPAPQATPGTPSAAVAAQPTGQATPEATPQATARPRTGNNSPTVKGVGTFSPASEAQRLLFMLALAVTLFGVFAAAYTIVSERSLFMRERMVNLRIAPYLASKTVVYSVLAMISCLITLLTMSLGVRLPDQGLITWGPLELFISMALTALAGVSLGVLLSAVNRQINAVTYAVLAVLFIQILFPGVLFKMDGILEPISRLTVTRWSLEALGGTADMLARNAEGRIVVETVPVNPRTGAPLVGAPPAKSYFPAPPALSVTYAASAGDLAVRWLVLLGWSALFLSAAGLVLNRSESF
jgi:ABC-type multidrug transport system ATPase subunit/pSer/pThr/pTyr-binding forkhead associated (FHA) protein